MQPLGSENLAAGEKADNFFCNPLKFPNFVEMEQALSARHGDGGQPAL